MNKAITLLRNGWTGLLLISLACFAITTIGIGPTWATWNLGLYTTMILLAVSTVASLAYMTWAFTRNLFHTPHGRVVKMPSQAKPADLNQASARKAA